MNGDITLSTLFLFGSFGGGHCTGMCDRLSNTFALQFPSELNRAGLTALPSLGRMNSYVFIGLLASAVGQVGIPLGQTRWLQNGLYLSTNLLLLFLGLYLTGISSLTTRIESIDRPVWKRPNPLLNRLLSIQSVSARFGVGMLWNWLPYGLVYGALLYASGSGNVLEGGPYMLAFALGTLPNLLAMRLFIAQSEDFLRRKTVRLATGLLVVVWVLWRLASFYVAS